MPCNPIYVGQIAHNGDCYEGQHPAIIAPETWERVRARLAAGAPVRPSRSGAGSPSPLRGKLFDEAGAPLTPTHTVKSGRRYRYYVSRNGTPEDAALASAVRGTRWRLAAREIERFVEEDVGALFSDPPTLARLAREAKVREAMIPDLLRRVALWTGRPLELVHRVDLAAQEVAVQIDLSPWLEGKRAVVRRGIRTRLRRRGVEIRLVLDGKGHSTKDSCADAALIKAIVRGQQWFAALASGRARSLAEIARSEGVSQRYVGHLIPLAFLAPDIVATILSGTQPVELTAEALTKRIDFPLDWSSQRALLGFD